MYFEKHFSQYGKLCKKPSILALVSAIFLSSCGSSNDDETGNIRFYNLSQNAPDLFFTIDENLDEDDDEDDFEATFSGVGFTEIGPQTAIETDNYFYEVAFADNDNDDERDDFEIVAEGEFSVRDEEVQLIVVTEDAAEPTVNIYSIPDITDDELDDDRDDDLFNIRILNTHATETSTIFVSDDNETINEAVELGSVGLNELSDNIKLEEGDFDFYLVDSTGEVVYEVDNIDFSQSETIQFVLVIRENTASTGSPFVLELISPSSIIELPDLNAETSFRAYNAFSDTPSVTFTLSDNNTSSEATLVQGELSERTIQANGTFGINILDADTGEEIVTSALIPLEANDDVTAFFFQDEIIEDQDGDGDLDEDGNGLPDDVRIVENILLVENNTELGFVSHEFQLLNFVEPDDFSELDFDFVRFLFITDGDTANNPTINQAVPFGSSASVTLFNNTYELIITAIVDSTTQILERREIVVTADTVPQFMVLEGDTDTQVYTLEVFDQ